MKSITRGNVKMLTHQERLNICMLACCSLQSSAAAAAEGLDSTVNSLSSACSDSQSIKAFWKPSIQNLNPNAPQEDLRINLWSSELQITE